MKKLCDESRAERNSRAGIRVMTTANAVKAAKEVCDGTDGRFSIE